MLLRTLAYIACINALFLALASLLMFVPAPIYALWLLGLLSSELSPHLFFCAVVLLALAFWALSRRRQPRFFLLAAVLSLLSALLAGWQTVSIIVFARERAEKISLLDSFLFKKVEANAAVKLEGKEYARPDGRPLELDVYQPSKPSRTHPAIVVIHGGSWRHGRRSDFAQYDLWLAGLGYTVFDLDYRLADGKVHFPAPVDDIEQALDWIELHAGDYAVDPRRICIMGRSAGAQLALAAAYRTAQAGRGKTRCAIALYGPTDLTWDYENPIQPDVIHSQEVIANYLGGSPGALPELYEKASACALVTDLTPPTLFVYGGRDQIVSRLNLERLATKLEAHKIPFQNLYLPWANHGFDWHFSGLSSQLSRHAIEKFLQQYL